MLADLAAVPWLLNGEGSHCSAAVLRLLDAAGLRPRVAGTVDDNHALLRLVAAGHGAGIVPALVLAGGAAGATVADGAPRCRAHDPGRHPAVVGRPRRRRSSARWRLRSRGASSER